MRINGISNDNRYNLRQSSPKKTTFEGYVSKFSKLLDNVLEKGECSFDDSFQLQRSLSRIVAKRIKNDEIIGEGSMARVFKIDSKYVVRFERWNYPVITGLDNNYENPYKDMRLKTYNGAYIATFGDAQILKNISPTGKQMPAGIPLQMTIKGTKEECQKYYEDVYLPTFAKLPQKAFDDIASDFDELNLCNDGNWYSFDILNPNNFVLVGKKIKIVDKIAKLTEDSYRMQGYDDKYVDRGMTTTDMMRVFLLNQDCLNECEFSEKALPLRRELFKKLVIAGVKNNLFVCNDENLYCLEKVAENLCKANCNSELIVKTLNNYRQEYLANPKKVLSDVSKYIDNIFSDKNIEIF